MFQRFVCFKFKDGTAPEAIRQHMAMFAALKDTIPQIVAYAGGMVLQNSSEPYPYDSAHYVTYATQVDIDVYFHHADHQAFIAANKAIWDQVLVVDSEIDSAVSSGE
ncbi:MAG: Dabb family protein [Anaerolineae bacterium]|nr:Dabb family protein [Anaerolineae bacterium]